MAKRLQRHPIQYKKNQAGCIWGFVSILDFRHGRSTPSLLEDRRCTGGRIVGAGYSRSELQKLTNQNGDSRETCDVGPRDALIALVAKTSVKELMEEEMISEQVQKQQMSNPDVQAKEFDEHRGRGKKNRKRTTKTSNSSCDIPCESDAAENVRLENSCHQDSVEKTNREMEVVVDELCQQVYPNSSSLQHDFNTDVDIQSVQAYSVFDENLFKAIKVIVDQRCTEMKHLTEEEKIGCSKEFIDALQTLSLNKELILKLLKDPNSLLVKHLQDLEDAQLEKDQNSNSLSRSNLIDGELKISKPSEPVPQKQHHNFFRRISMSREKFPLTVHENGHTAKRIVILKSGPASVHISESEAKLSSSVQPHQSSGTKVQSKRVTSQFSFTRIKRKLKHAMRKERDGVPSDDVTRRVPYEQQNSGNSEKSIGGAKGGWTSTRNKFYNKKNSKVTIGIKNKDKICEPKDTETSMGNEAVDSPKLRVSNDTYIEAKKHLSEMLSNGDEFEDYSSGQLRKTLGRIISLPEFNCPTNFVTAQKLSNCKSFHMVYEDSWQLMQENDVSHLGPSRPALNSQSCITDNPEKAVQSCHLNPDVFDELNGANAAEETLCSVRREKRPEGDAELGETTYASVSEESKVLEILDEQDVSLVTGDDKNDLTDVCEEEEYAQCLKSDSFEQDQLPSSPLASPPSSRIIKHVGDLDSADERPERASPVSVLEPSFSDDDISPTIIKSQPVEPAMQPREIIFNMQFSSPANQEIDVRACMEDEESAFDYVEAVLLASDLNWEEFLLRWISSDEILDASLFDEVELFSNRSHHDQKLLFDCTNEILKEVCECYFGYSPWVSFTKHNIRPIPSGELLIHEVWDRVEWHLLSGPSPSTLDQLVGKDMAKKGTWMDLRFDVENIGIDIGETIFEELMEESVLTYINEGPDIDSSMPLEELVEIE